MANRIECRDCLDFLRDQPDGSIDLVFGSPPYEQARLYLEDGSDMNISRKTPQWVQWMADVHEAAQKACKGLVAFVVAGQTRKFQWSAGPVLYMAELHQRGLNLRNPPIFSRVGIPGSGGPDWLRADYEWIVCTSRMGKLPWSDNTACGKPPKWAPGGDMSYRDAVGNRKNAVAKITSANGDLKPRGTHAIHKNNSKRAPDKQRNQSSDIYHPPAIANPGNIIRCTVGGGQLGHEMASLNEAPFPLKLAEFFVQSFCPPGGVVCDPFSGSGTTAHAAMLHGRNFIGCDLRQSQVDLTNRRLAGITPGMFS